MTDNEIVKALECCDGSFDKCGECPLDSVNQDKLRCWELEKSALDLINRLQAKLDEAEDTIQFADKELKKANTEIERLQKELKITRAYIHDNGLEWGLVSHLEFYKNQRAEAYKAFAEIVKKIDFYQYIEEYYENAELCYEFRQDWFNEKIDNLLKELVG